MNAGSLSAKVFTPFRIILWKQSPFLLSLTNFQKKLLNFAFLMRKFSFVFIALLVLFLGSCKSAHEKILASKDVNYKLTKANEYYDQKQYYKSNQIYEALIPVMRGAKNYEEMYYRYCYSFYYQNDYLSASYQFKNFVEFFPKSSKADECEFKYATCLYKLSPAYSKDQSSTYKSIEALQTYINTHPGSPNLTLANNYMDIARAKIETKDAKAAQLYFDMSEYKSACIAYKSLIQTYPESKVSDQYQLMLIRSYFKYAELSIEEKQEERYVDAINAYNDMAQYTPNSLFLKEAQTYYNSAQKNIKTIRSNEHK
jgi:outer membrane protein assembly factor BamD